MFLDSDTDLLMRDEKMMTSPLSNLAQHHQFYILSQLKIYTGDS